VRGGCVSEDVVGRFGGDVQKTGWHQDTPGLWRNIIVEDSDIITTIHQDYAEYSLAFLSKRIIFDDLW
jgi:hypothetical protein